MKRSPMRRTRFKVKPRDLAKAKAWRAIKEALWVRGHGRCEVPWCEKMANDAHHVIKRSQGGQDTLRGCIAICRHHHDLTDVAVGRGRLYVKPLTFKGSLVPTYGFHFFQDRFGWMDQIGPFTDEDTP